MSSSYPQYPPRSPRVHLTALHKFLVPRYTQSRDATDSNTNMIYNKLHDISLQPSQVQSKLKYIIPAPYFCNAAISFVYRTLSSFANFSYLALPRALSAFHFAPSCFITSALDNFSFDESTTALRFSAQ